MDTGNKRIWVVTGGQSGVDRAAMDVALELMLPLRGWCPKGRLAEDGLIDPHYPLQETPSADVSQRTEWNARDSDGTLVLNTREHATDGTKLTYEVAEKYQRSCFEIFLEDEVIDVISFWNWIDQKGVRILNIAGPRESRRPGFIYRRAVEILRTLLMVN